MTATQEDTNNILDFHEPKESKRIFITLRPHNDNKFTNEKEERDKITNYANTSNANFVVIGKELNEDFNHNTYHYHIIIETTWTSKPSKINGIKKDMKKLFPDHIALECSCHVRFMDKTSNRVIGYICKDGDYTFSGNIDEKTIAEYTKNYKDSITPKIKKKKKYAVKKKIPDVFNVLLEFCSDNNIKHCNYIHPKIDDRGMTRCDNFSLFVIDNKEFINMEYLIRYFRRETKNLLDADTDKIEKLAKYILFSIDEFEQTVVSNRYVAFDNGKILIDGQNSKILTHEEATEVLNTYTPLHIYEENPVDQFKRPEFFCSLIEKTKKGDEIMEMLRYYMAGENNETILSYQLMGEGNTAKTTIIEYIVKHYGIHAKKLTEEGKFTFSGTGHTLLRWSDEINTYQLYECDGTATILLGVLDRKEMEVPVKHKDQKNINGSYFLTATNPERHNKRFTIKNNNYDTSVYEPLNNRIKQLCLDKKFPRGKIDNMPIIMAELAYVSYMVSLNQPVI